MIEQHRNALPAGYRLESFRLGSVLGHGGFGITYRALDEDLQQAVAIKEYLPREVAFRDQDSTVVPLSESDRETFEWGLERFLDEARTLARFRHLNIVGVRRFLRANGTAYLVMDYCEGESLESVLAREGTLPAERLEAMLKPLLDALRTLHVAGVTHRDIKPGNIYLRADGSPVLLDFGAARQALAQHSRSVTAMATPGYAAFEQYSTKGKQGPWTDIYGLGATLYRCVMGQRPSDASDRMLEDDLVPAVEAAAGRYPHPLLAQIDSALKMRPEDRPQSLSGWCSNTPTGSTAMLPEETLHPHPSGLLVKRPDDGGVPLLPLDFGLLPNDEAEGIIETMSHRLAEHGYKCRKEFGRWKVIEPLGGWHFANSDAEFYAYALPRYLEFSKTQNKAANKRKKEKPSNGRKKGGVRGDESPGEIIDKLYRNGYRTKRDGSGWLVCEPLGGRQKIGTEVELIDYARGRIGDN